MGNKTPPEGTIRPGATLEEANLILIRAELARMRDRITALEADAVALHRRVDAEAAALLAKHEHLAAMLEAHLSKEKQP